MIRFASGLTFWKVRRFFFSAWCVGRRGMHISVCAYVLHVSGLREAANDVDGGKWKEEEEDMALSPGARLRVSRVSYRMRMPPPPAGDDDEQGGGDEWTFFSAAVLVQGTTNLKGAQCVDLPGRCFKVLSLKKNQGGGNLC